MISCLRLVVYGMCVLGFLLSVRCVDLPIPDALSHLGVQGHWQSLPAEHGNGTSWQVTPNRLRLVIPTLSSTPYDVQYTDPLPQGDWTIDFWIAEYGETASTELTFSLGPFNLMLKPENSRGELRVQPQKMRSGPFYFVCGSGRFQWGHVVYHRNEQRLFMAINGQPAVNNAKIALPDGPLFFRAKSHYGATEDYAVEIAAFQVREGAVDWPTNLTGMAYRGWTATKATIPGGPFSARLEALAESPQNTAAGRAWAWSALALLDWQAKGAVSPEHWTKLQAFCTNGSEKDPTAALIAWPYAVACAGKEQRAQASVLSTTLCNALAKNHLTLNGTDITTALVRAVTLDPLATLDTFYNDYNARRPPSELFQCLTAAAPEQVVPLRNLWLSADNWSANALAWQLPNLHRTAPAMEQLTIDLLTERSRHKSQYEDIDCALSFAAYRVAPYNLLQAMTFLKGIKASDVKAETLQYITEEVPAAQTQNNDALIDAAMLDAIACWNPTPYSDSPVEEIMRLVRWYTGRGRKADADRLLRQAIKQVGKLPFITFRDTHLIAQYLREINSPEADAWLERAANAAVAADAGHSDYGGSGIYLGATPMITRDLVKAGKIDLALATIRKLDADMLPLCKSQAMAQVIFAVADTDIERARTLLDDVPEERREALENGLAKREALKNPRAAQQQLDGDMPPSRRLAITTALVPTFRRGDAGTAARVIGMLPADQRLDLLLTLSATIPLNTSEKLQSLLGEAVAARLPQLESRHDEPRLALLQQLSVLSLPDVIALEPAFAKNPEVYSHLLCNATAAACGLRDDPLQQLLQQADRSRYGSIPWGAGRLRNAIVAAQNPANL